MTITLQALRTLSYKGSPLDLTVRQDPGNPNACQFINADGRSCTIQETISDYEMTRIRSALRHYPDAVTLNGQKLETLPFPDLAHVSITSYPNNDEESKQWTPIKEFPSATVEGNAYAAGVCCYISTPPNDFPFTYYTPSEAGNDFWTKAKTVTLKPLWVMSTEEVDDPETFHDHRLRVAHGSPMLGTILKRAKAQVERTLSRSELPPRHQGPVHRYLIEQEQNHFRTGVPIIVHGIPISLDEDLERPLSQTAIHTLYTTNQKYVPVSQHRGNENDDCYHPFMSPTEFTKTPERHASNWAVAKAERITMHFTVEEYEERPEETLEIQAPFLLTGQSWDIQAFYVPGMVSKDSLSDAMALAYWEEKDYSSWDDIKEALSDIESRMYELVSAEFEDSDKVFQTSLERFANSYHPEIPKPSEPLTVTSADGRTTVTYMPA